MKKKNLAFTAVVLLVVAGSIYLQKFFTNLGTFLFSFALSFSLIFLALLFSSRAVFSAWLKFAKWYIPIAFILILITAGTFTGGSWGPSYDLDAEGMTILTSTLFLLLSLALIGWKSWKLKGK